MGFQSGSQIRPELGALDYSGYTNAAAINAQALSNLGQQVGEGIQKYQQNKEITSAMIASFEGKVKADPSLLPAIQGMGTDVSKAYNNFTEGKYSKKDAMLLNGAASTFLDQRQINEQMLMERRKLDAQLAPEPTIKLSASQVSEYIGKGYNLKGMPTEDGGLLVNSASADAPSGPLVNVNTGSGPDTSEFDKELAKKTASNVVDWELGGRVNAEANLEAYNDIYSRLASGEVDTRTLADMSPVLTDELRALFNPTGQAAVDTVRKVVFQSLRDTLGAQFTEREGIRLTNATYNPTLSEEENMRRMQVAGNVLKRTIEAKNEISKFISKGGQMKDYNGETPLEAFNNSLSSIEPKQSEANKVKSKIPEDIDPQIWNLMSEEDKKLWN